MAVYFIEPNDVAIKQIISDFEGDDTCYKSCFVISAGETSDDQFLAFQNSPAQKYLRGWDDILSLLLRGIKIFNI